MKNFIISTLLTGFHIGLAFNQQFTDIWGVRGELVFSQKGFSNTYDGNSSVILLDRNDRAITHSGIADIDLSWFFGGE